MPGSEDHDGGGFRPHTVIFWAGAGLAPLAALLVLFSSGTQALRVATLLSILAVVLVGLSVMLRPDASKVREEVEEAIFDEVDTLRAGVRNDISSAARATHKSLSEKLQNLHERLEALRGQVDAMRDMYESRHSASSTGSSSPVGRAAPVSSVPRSVGTAMVSGGMVRHTEMVQVTRQTIVDQPGSDRGRLYGTGSRYGQRDESDGAQPGRRRAEPDDRRRERSWTEERLRDRLRDTGTNLFGDPDRFIGPEGSGRTGGNGHEAGHREEGYPRRLERDEGYSRRDEGYPRREEGYPRRLERDEHDVDVPSDPRWSDLRAGDRWASVRSDDRGRELRMGERRAAVHNDGSGTEMRIEDRWAAVRREEEGRGRTDAPGLWPDGEAFRARNTGSQPALPATDTYGPSWGGDWREETGGGHRVREHDDQRQREEMPRSVSGARRRLDFDRTDDRWR
jgi:hypothetical protein